MGIRRPVVGIRIGRWGFPHGKLLLVDLMRLLLRLLLILLRGRRESQRVGALLWFQGRGVERTIAQLDGGAGGQAGS